MRILLVSGAVMGRPFIKFAHEQGHQLLVLTHEKMLDGAWPRDHVEEVVATASWKRKDIRNTVSFLAQRRKIDRVIAVSDWDVETVCMLREHMRIPGMGETTMRYFRDKLAMRMKAKEGGVRVPDFVRILNHEEVYEFMQRVPPPWIIKPRSAAASVGVKKLRDDQEVWKKILELGDEQSDYLLEQYIPGEVYHVDSIVWDRKVRFRGIAKYGKSMLDLNVSGGVYSSRLLPRTHPDWQALYDFNDKLVETLGLVRGPTHAEYIKGEDGQFYFLECGARVGSAKIADVLWHGTDVCLWHEWVKTETQDKYKVPKFREEYAASIMCLSRHEWPDMSAFADPEVKWVQKKAHHAGIILASPDPDRVAQLEQDYRERFARDFMAHVPTADHRN
ncbi:MAG: ATP-grasp domain-containing protein [Candidatus Sericytochromatia bacterium]|nr:ATP-grasp domain-containing protein [Candidatus Tanganyikabacteria bacterium]